MEMPGTKPRANARLALTIAIGQLQKNLGPDARISANAEIISPDSSNPHIAGSWSSWKIDPNSPPTAGDYTQDGKADKFLGWLASSRSAPEDSRMEDIPAEESGDSTITLLSNTGANTSSQSNEVRAETILIQDQKLGAATGSYAYAVMDEGVKARIDLGEYQREGGLGMSSSNLGSAQRNSIEDTALLGSSKPDLLQLGDPDKPDSKVQSYLSKFISTETSQLALEKEDAIQGQLKGFPHDFTIHSTSVLSNSAAGGLKMDLSLLAGIDNPPNSILQDGVYETAFDDFDEVTDPRWSLFQDFAGLYNDNSRVNFDTNPPSISPSIPEDWTAGQYEEDGQARKFQALTDPLPGTVLLPSIAKVQVAFSLAARDMLQGYGRAPTAAAQQLHSPWGNRFKGSGYFYLLHLIYTPIITLYNPYNVNLQFTDLVVEFSNVPLSFQIFRNNIPLTTDLVPWNRCSLRTQNSSDTSRLQKRFRVSITGPNDGNSQPHEGAPVTLLPGEVRIFSPYIDPNQTWQQEIGSGNNSERKFSDWTFNDDSGDGNSSNIRTDQLKASSGYRGAGVGYSTDWLQPVGYQATTGNNLGLGGVIGLKPTDNIHVEFVPASDIGDRSVDRAIGGKFSVAMYLDKKSEDPERSFTDPASVVQFDFDDGDKLRELLAGSNSTLRFPESGSINAEDLHDKYDLGIGEANKTQAFAVISAYGKTTLGNSDATDFDGRYSTKGWSFNNPTLPIVFHDISAEHMSQHSHNLDAFTFEGIAQGVDDLTSVDSDDRSPFFNSHDGGTGKQFGTHFEIPLAPIQSLTTLNSSNPVASGLLPLFNNPIGNSLAHPLLSTSTFTAQSATSKAEQSGGSYNYLDHSFLLNSILFDQTWLSTFSDRSNGLLDGKTLQTQVDEFYNQGINSSLESRLEPFLPAGISDEQPATLLGNVRNSASPWQSAAFSMLRGGFNVNSTSVEAWKAVLGGLTAQEVTYLGFPDPALPIGDAVGEESFESDGAALFSRFRVPNAGASKTDEAFWQGAISLDEAELDALAQQVVAEVKLRGPFLSLGEFLNRQLGASSQLTLKGALQAAIDNTSINDASSDGVNGYDIQAGQLAGYDLETPEAVEGPSAEGAPGFLMQADIISTMSNSMTVRSDTFRIRAYGESRSKSGQTLATAYCEAIVQRTPDYLDTSDAPWNYPQPEDGTTSPTAKLTEEHRSQR